MQEATARGGRWAGVRHWACGLAVLLPGLLPAWAGVGAADVPAAPPQPPSARQPAGHEIDARVERLSKALDLDEKQRMELGRLLVQQREQVARIWSDASVPAPYRVNATQVVSDRTADQIRAMLNDEQRTKFNPPRRQRAADAAVRPDVEAWMRPSAAMPGAAPATR